MKTKLRFLKHPRYKDAHPDDNLDIIGPCPACAIAEDDKGDRFLLWRSNSVHWSLSRHDPKYGTDVRLGEIELVNEPK